MRAIGERLAGAGHRAWLVGGCVRDALRGRAPRDWDILTSAGESDLERLFPRVRRVNERFVTVLVGVAPGAPVRQVSLLEGRTLEADLARRDFTVNAIAIDPVDGHVIDPFDGQGDLARRVLRAVGSASERFAEDGLRALRAARFVASLDLELDAATAAAIRPALDTYRKVSAERVRDEWIKTLKAQRPSRAFDVMREHGLLETSAPELVPQYGCAQNRYHRYDVWGHAMMCVDAAVGDPILRLSALLHDVGKPATRAHSDKTNDYTFYDHERVGAEMVDPLLARLRFSTAERERVTHLVRHHLVCYEPGWSNAAVRRWIQRIGRDRLADMYALNEADIRAKDVDAPPELEPLIELRARVDEILARGEALHVRDLAIGGHELMDRLGMAPGPRLGMMLERLLEEVLEDPGKNVVERLLTRAAEILPELPETKPKRP